MPDAEPMYNLKAVVQYTGIPAASLRAWERRYGIPAPVRKPNGHRLYPKADVERLLKIKDLMARGMTVSQAVDQLDVTPAEPAPPAPAGEAERLRAGLAAALAAADTARANQLFGQALDLLPAEQVALKLIRPLLPDLSDFGRTYLRLRLGALLLHAAPPAGAPGALVLNPAVADLRPLLVALLLSRRGHRVIYVEGTEAPAGLKPDLIIDPRRWRDDVPPEQLFE